MAEQFKSITEVRKALPALSQVVQQGADRFVITNQGKPQSVLMGYEEYRGLLAADELLNRPGELASLQRGMAQKTRLSFSQVKENLQQREARSSVEEGLSPQGQVAAHPPDEQSKLDEMHGWLGQIVKRLEDPVRDPVLSHRRADFAEQLGVKKAIRLAAERPLKRVQE